jgi:hypothetical protein
MASSGSWTPVRSGLGAGPISRVSCASGVSLMRRSSTTCPPALADWDLCTQTATEHGDHSPTNGGGTTSGTGAPVVRTAGASHANDGSGDLGCVCLLLRVDGRATAVGAPDASAAGSAVGGARATTGSEAAWPASPDLLPGSEGPRASARRACNSGDD